ncbi:hypothetical protein pipiens_012041 [Culex pipiens pipiens]|uniref:Uncharacterized protein n=1 Tax=Culex pipiens pipiens TaxID=38569 RepID=A0ABD1D3Y7_CULPP
MEANTSDSKPLSDKIVLCGKLASLKPKFIDLVPDLTVYKLDINGRASRWTCLAEPGFEFKVKVSPEKESVYKVTLSMEKGQAGEYRMALGNEPLAPIKLKLREEVTLGRIKPEKASSSVTIRLELAKTYAEKCRQYRAFIEQLIGPETALERLIGEMGKIITGLVLVVAFLAMIVLKFLW